MQPSFIDRLKEKPAHKRHMYAAGSSLVIVVAIFVVWLTVKMPGTSGETQTVAVQDQKTTSVQARETESLFGAFGDSVGQVFTGFKNAFGSIKDKFGSKTKYEANENPFQTE